MRLQATIACAGGLVLWMRFGGVLAAALAGCFASLALIAWVAPARYVPVQRGFDFLTRVLVAGFSWVMLGLVYFGVFTPLRLIGVLVGRDPLGLKRPSDTTTYLRPMPAATTGRFNRQF
jgi:hypothetical protein